MRVLIVVIALVLTGCAQRDMLTPAQREKLAATQAVVDERVRAGQMTEAEGRLHMATAKAAMDAETRRTIAIMSSGDGPATYQPVGGGTVVRY